MAKVQVFNRVLTRTATSLGVKQGGVRCSCWQQEELLLPPDSKCKGENKMKRNPNLGTAANIPEIKGNTENWIFHRALLFL